jgi:cobaltochelatase CobN
MKVLVGIPPSGLPAISPSRGEIGRHDDFRQPATLQKSAQAQTASVISPLEGEMAGRPEGGANRRKPCRPIDRQPEARP